MCALDVEKQADMPIPLSSLQNTEGEENDN